ncbi:MAG: hypothetical protein O6918_00555 [Deltaproteobacteria bacterium]|nr:hypothetical protein [Deltaproteobacteria bacterium]
MKASDKIELWESVIILGFILIAAVLSRLFIFSFKLIPLTAQTGGDELFYAFVGGVALAFSAPTLPLLVLYLTILFTAVKAPYELTRGRRIVLIQASLFLLAFASIFIIGISGVPILIANSLYKGQKIINIFGGILIALYGFKAFNGWAFITALRFTPLAKRRRGLHLLEAPMIGFIAGLLLFPYLDPSYDSVFFLTGRAGALSHHPLSVSSFGLGLSAMYVALAYGLSLLFVFSRLGRVIGWAKGASGFLTVILGLSLASGTFLSLSALINKGY